MDLSRLPPLLRCIVITQSNASSVHIVVTIDLILSFELTIDQGRALTAHPAQPSEGEARMYGKPVGIKMGGRWVGPGPWEVRWG